MSELIPVVLLVIQLLNQEIPRYIIITLQKRHLAN